MSCMNFFSDGNWSVKNLSSQEYQIALSRQWQKSIEFEISRGMIVDIYVLY